MDWLVTGSGILVLLFSLLWPWFWSLTCFSLLTISSVAFGLGCAIWAHIYLSSQHYTPTCLLEHIEKDLQVFRENISIEPIKGSKASTGQQSHLPVVFGRTVDGLLQQLIDLILRDFLVSWLKDYAFKPEITIEQFKEDLWGAVQDLNERISRVDGDKLIACDMVTKITLHFEKIRIAQSSVAETNSSPVFALSPYLISTAAEMNFLRQISELFIMFLLPRCYSLAPATHLLREVLTCKILQPAINMITEPDYLNMKILSYLEAQRAAAAVHSRTHEYARSFEDFLKLIQNCNDIDTLKRIRYNIVAEIMQATTLQNMNRARGVEADTGADGASGGSGGRGGAAGVGRRQVAAARKLRRYISQLSYAKGQCESALTALGWEGPFPSHDSDNAKVLSLATILESVLGRRHLSLFLETLCSQGLVGYWTAVEELRASHRSNWHQLGAEIFYTYIRSPSAEIKVDKETRKRMEAFLLGDKGPEVFYEVQQMVINTLQDKYYQSFLLSEQYRSLIKALANDDDNKDQQVVENSPMEERQLSGDSVSSNESAVGALNVGEHSSYARKKLEQLQERYDNKTQALQALRASLKPESKVLELLQREVMALAGERRRLEAHLARAHTWAQHLGKWRATVQSAEIIEDSQPPQFVLVVQKDEPSGDGDDDDPEAISTGWVLLRSLQHFQELHRKLRPLCAGVKNLELPSNSFKFLFVKTDKNSLDKAKMQIQKYLDFILEDERLNQSEAIYAFLSPSSEHLKHNMPSPKKSRFSFSTLFKSGSNDSAPRAERGELPIRESGDDDEISLYLDGESGEMGSKAITNGSRGILGVQSGSDDGKDGIAEPLYTLMGEVFDMRGVFKWLRKTLISFVQITYGRTINRQIRDTITWIFSEPMLHYYISIIMKSWWPGGVLSKSPEDRTQTMKDETRHQARQQFINNIPEVLTSLMGAQSAQRGAQKIFDTLQNHMQNKQLFYELFELLLVEVFPELKQHM